MLVEAVSNRLSASVNDLANRVSEAADLAALVAKDALPPSPLSAFVLPLGLRPRSEGDAMAQAFLQAYDELIGVLLVIRSPNDLSGARALPKVDALVGAVIGAIAGWGPDEEPDVFRLARGQLLPAGQGLTLYQLDFAISRQLRIIT